MTTTGIWTIVAIAALFLFAVVLAMGETAENVAEDYQVARKDQDGFALRSSEMPADGTAELDVVAEAG